MRLLWLVPCLGVVFASSAEAMPLRPGAREDPGKNGKQKATYTDLLQFLSEDAAGQ